MSEREETVQERPVEGIVDPDAIVDDEVAIRYDRRVAWRKIFGYLLVGVCAVILLLIAVDKMIMPWYVKLGEVARVPDIVGLPYDEAARRLEKMGFEVKKGEPRFDSRFPAGTVVMQLPYGGAQTKMGRRIYLTLSRGTELTPMPDLLGMPLREARIALMRAGLEVGEMIYENNDTMMKGLVFAQSIPAKVGARPGTIVDVMISRGPSTQFTMMPNLLSLDIEQARTRLENAGLTLGVVLYKDDPSYVRNTVIEQTIAPYSQVAQGAAVNLTICGASEPDDNIVGDEDAELPQVHNLSPPPTRTNP